MRLESPVLVLNLFKPSQFALPILVGLFAWTGVSAAAPLADPRLICQRNFLKDSLSDKLFGEQRSIIEDHSIMGLSRRFKRGLGISIDIPQLEDVSVSGELIQARFIKGILETIFPHAQWIRSSFAHDQKKSRHIHFDLFDSAEKSRVPIDPNQYLDMIDIKSANGFLTSRKMTDVRRLVGLPQSKRIAHLYIRFPYGKAGVPSMMPALIKTLKAKGFEWIIVSSRFEDDGTQFRRWLDRHHPDTARLFPLQKNLMDIRQRDAEADSMLIYNDTQGAMPYVHAAVDVSIVAGPLNLFEALYAGVPTIWLVTPELQSDYAQQGIDRLKLAAEEFPNFQMAGSLKELLDLETQPRPTDLTGFQHQALTRLLDLLEEKISRQLDSSLNRSAISTPLLEN